MRLIAPSLTPDASNGGWQYTALWQEQDYTLRVLLHIDHSYAWQSSLRIEFLTPEGWKELHTLAPDTSASQQHSSYGRPFPSEALRAAAAQDEGTLLGVALHLLQGLRCSDTRTKEHA